MPRRVVVSGLGVVSSLGASREAFRDGLLSGLSGLAPITAFDVRECRTRFAAPVSGFDAAAWIPPMKLRRMEDTARYAVVSARQSFEDAAYSLAADGADDVGVILGTFTAGGQATVEYLTALHRGGPTGAPALLFNSTVANAPASLAGLEFKLRGPNVTVSQKEASGLAAVVSAVDVLRLGRTRAVVAGGVDAIFDVFYRVHDRFGVMAPSDELFQGPFDARRRGFVLGEGGFALLLEDAEAVTARGAKWYGDILGVGAVGATPGINLWPSTPEPIVRAMQAALDDAGVAPSGVDVVYASANASPGLDRVEALALRELFSGARPLVTSIKGAIGECGAASAAACVAALLCGAAGEVPPIAGLATPDEAAAELNLVTSRQRLGGPIALVNGVASGGSIVSVVLKSA
jgi:3-oxoacyl-[acyl-carrier-protein] synthase II